MHCDELAQRIRRRCCRLWECDGLLFRALAVQGLSKEHENTTFDLTADWVLVLPGSGTGSDRGFAWIPGSGFVVHLGQVQIQILMCVPCSTGSRSWVQRFVTGPGLGSSCCLQGLVWLSGPAYVVL